jgi:hypothetical protein
MADDLRFHLNLCSCDDGGTSHALTEPVQLFGREYSDEYNGPVDVDYRVDGDRVKFTVPERNLDVSLGPVAGMAAVLIRARPQRTTIQALYEDIDTTLDAACCHSSSGGVTCECYGAIACTCVAIVEAE